MFGSAVWNGEQGERCWVFIGLGCGALVGALGGPPASPPDGVLGFGRLERGVYTYIAAPPNRVPGGVCPIFAEILPRIGSRLANRSTFWKISLEAFGYSLDFLV